MAGGIVIGITPAGAALAMLPACMEGGAATLVGPGETVRECIALRMLCIGTAFAVSESPPACDGDESLSLGLPALAHAEINAIAASEALAVFLVMLKRVA